jgi:uncharacterized damage-inducible protein DinB
MSTHLAQPALPEVPVRSAAEYAAAITAITDEIIDAVEPLTDGQWRRVTSAEQWPVAVVAHHACAVQRAFASVLDALERGAPVPEFSAEDVERNNARHARAFADVSQEETLRCLRRHSVALSEAARRLPPERITSTAGTFGGFEMTVAQLLEFAVIGHLREHLASIRETVAA